MHRHRPRRPRWPTSCICVLELRWQPHSALESLHAHALWWVPPLLQLEVSAEHSHPLLRK